MYVRFFSGLLVVVGMTGCASTAEYMRSQPVTHFPAAATVVVPVDLKGLLTLHCMKDQETSYEDRGVKTRECLYISADASAITSPINATDAPAVRDKAISFLTSLSDMNCSNFLHRAFANKAGLDFTKGFMSDLASGISAGTAHANPAVSAALSVSNLIVGKGVESFNATYYYDKTFQALESAIAAERLRIRTYIAAKQVQANRDTSAYRYEIVQAMSDIRAYDDACSIKAGLAQLVQLADTQKRVDEKIRIEVELSDAPVSTARDLMGIKKK